MADNNANTVILSTNSYNQIKATNFRHDLFLDNLLQEAELSYDHQHLVFDSQKVEEIIKVCYLERYKRKLATLKTQESRYGKKV